MKPIKQFIKFTFIFYAIVAFVYWIFIRHKNMNWGATKAEIEMKFPFKEYISPNRIVSTRAINIKASKQNV
jgi:hypothetical protein